MAKSLECACKVSQSVNKNELAKGFGIKHPALAETFSKVCQKLATSFLKAQESNNKEKGFLLTRKTKIADRARRIVLESLGSLTRESSSDDETSTAEESDKYESSSSVGKGEGEDKGKVRGIRMKQPRNFGYNSHDEMTTTTTIQKPLKASSQKRQKRKAKATAPRPVKKFYASQVEEPELNETPLRLAVNDDAAVTPSSLEFPESPLSGLPLTTSTPE